MFNQYNPLHLFLASQSQEFKNRIYYRPLLKESINPGNSTLASFSYNGLIYTFNPDLNMFVNQFGHAMDYAQAVALASSVGYTDQDFEDLEDVSDYDGGGHDRRSAIVAATNQFLYAHGSSPYGWPNGLTAWPTTFDDTKGLSYFYPYLFFWPDDKGPDPVKAAAGTLTQLDDFGFTGYWARGTNQATATQSAQGGLQYQWNFDISNGYFQQPQVPTSGASNFTFGATGHALTQYVDTFIEGFSWIPADKRLFFAAKPYSFANATSGVTGIECRLSRFNYLTRGNSFTNWTSVQGGTFLSSGHTAPSGVTTGTLSASLISLPGTLGPQLTRTVSLPEGGRTYTFSVFLQGITANTTLELDFGSGPGSGQVTLGTAWQRFQIQKFQASPGNVTAIISGNDGTPGVTWASQARIWGAQAELGENVSTTSNSYQWYLDTDANIASSVVQNQSNQRSMWLARKGAWAERELRNFLTALKDRGFTMGRMSIDDESYNQMAPYLYDRKTTDYIWEYNTLKINESPGGNTWWASFTGASAQPRCLFQRTNNRFGLPGVTNFRDLLLLRGFTTNSSGGGFIDQLKFDSSNSKNSVAFSDSRSSSGNLFEAVVKEMNSAFIEDALVTPFKEIMLGDTGNTTAIIYNYGYVDSFAAFVGNTYLTPTGGATTASVTGSNINLIIPNYNQMWPFTNNNAIESANAVSWQNFKDDYGYSRYQLSYSKCGNQPSISTYGTFMQSGDGYGYYLTDHIMNPNPGFSSTTHPTVFGAGWGARNIFDFNRVISGNSYGYAGATWGNTPRVAYLQAGMAGSLWPGQTRKSQVHIPGRWRGITMNGGAGETLSLPSYNTSSLLANYTGICGPQMGVTCLGCNDQTAFVLDYFFNELWGLTQSSQVTDNFCGINIIPTSVRAATQGLPQGSITAQWATANTGAQVNNSLQIYFDEAGRPIPGITMVPGTIYRDYDTHWYPLGWMALLQDLGAHRESARSRVYEALEKRSRTGNSSVPQEGYTIFVHNPSYGNSNFQNFESNFMRVDNPEYVQNACGGCWYHKPVGITYDVVRCGFANGSVSIELRGITLFYGGINHYWAENIRHAYLHKTVAIEQWGNSNTMCVVNSGRNTVTLDNGQGGWRKSYWRVGNSPSVTNPDEIKTMLGNNAVFRVGNLESGFSGFCGFTMGGVEPNRAYRLGGGYLNSVISDCNTRGNGIVHETMYLAPINWASKSYTISGAQLVDSSYLWRISFLHKATEQINVRGSQTGVITSYNIAGITNFIDNPNHEKGIWWTSNVYEIPIVVNPPVPLNPGLPPGTTTWNGISFAGSSSLFPLGMADTDIQF